MVVKVGMIIKHIDAVCNWTAEFIRIEGNDLHAIIRSETSGSWPETWNLEHTEVGLKNGEYVEVLLG